MMSVCAALWHIVLVTAVLVQAAITGLRELHHAWERALAMLVFVPYVGVAFFVLLMALRVPGANWRTFVMLLSIQIPTCAACWFLTLATKQCPVDTFAFACIRAFFEHRLLQIRMI